MPAVRRVNVVMDGVYENWVGLGTPGTVYIFFPEKKCSDLEKAEAEVDLLGDEVDTLLNLVEKIYIALDHYSPILQHYPGITEILKLVRRELSAEINLFDLPFDLKQMLRKCLKELESDENYNSYVMPNLLQKQIC